MECKESMENSDILYAQLDEELQRLTTVAVNGLPRSPLPVFSADKKAMLIPFHIQTNPNL